MEKYIKKNRNLLTNISQFCLFSHKKVLYNTNNSFSELFEASRDLKELARQLPALRKVFFNFFKIKIDFLYLFFFIYIKKRLLDLIMMILNGVLY